MTVWAWVLVGVAAWLAISILAGLAVAAVLRAVTFVEASAFLESDSWVSAPLMRSDESGEDVSAEQEVSARHAAGRESDAVRHGRATEESRGSSW